MNNIAYNNNPELVAMKQDIADRKFRIQMTGLLIGGGLLVGALLVGGAAAMLVPGATEMALAGGAGGVKLALATGMGIASGITALVTLKEVKKLEIDEKYLQSYMSGKNYWGEGYREEVLEHGHSVGAPPIHGAPPLPRPARTR